MLFLLVPLAWSNIPVGNDYAQVKDGLDIIDPNKKWADGVVS